MKHALLFGLVVLAPAVRAQTATNVRLPRLVADHMVLQRDRPVGVWGWADPGGRVTVRLAGASASATVGADRTWRAELPAMGAGGPYTMTVDGARTTTVRDVLVGEVWLASGQSNMEFPLRRVDGAEAEVAAAQYPEIRLFSVPYRWALTPQDDLDGGAWEPATPESAAGFSAVAYLFGRQLHAELGVPVGLIDASWGGSAAEAWVSAAALTTLPDVEPLAAPYVADPQATADSLDAENDAGLAAWAGEMQSADAGFAARPTWRDPAFEPDGWGTMALPGRWEENGLPSFNGTVWFRRTVTLPADWAGADLEFRTERIEDQDSTWVNGVAIGSRTQVGDARRYRVPADILRPGENVITVWVHDRTGFGGLTAPVELVHPDGRTMPLDGPWRYRVGTQIGPGPAQPRLLWHQQPGLLFNGLIAPLTASSIRGALWYQGESNTRRAFGYRTLLPTLVADWRDRWAEGAFPFLVVQLPNFHGRGDDPNEPSSWAELREAQSMIRRLPNTGVTVTIDLGDPDDIHPTNKQDVADRLARQALADVYGRAVVGAGPTVLGRWREGEAVRLLFGGVGGGLVARGGALDGFAVAGSDRRFVWADARIEGRTVVVSSPAVADPVAVRYGWADNPAVTLYNAEGLPAEPFRTDDWPGETGPEDLE